MKFVNTETGTEYEVAGIENGIGLGSNLLEGYLADGTPTHLLRIEVYPLPQHPETVQRILQAMNLAALEALQQCGAGLDLAGIPTIIDSAGLGETPTTKH